MRKKILSIFIFLFAIFFIKDNILAMTLNFEEPTTARAVITIDDIETSDTVGSIVSKISAETGFNSSKIKIRKQGTNSDLSSSALVSSLNVNDNDTLDVYFTYTITFNYYKNDDTNVTSSSKTAKTTNNLGSIATYNTAAATRVGYTFIGWTDGDSEIAAADAVAYFNTYKPTKNVTYTAVYDAITYDIDITLDDGISIDPDDTSVTVNYNDTYDMMVTINPNYELLYIMVNNDEVELENDTLTIANILEDKEVTFSTKIKDADYTAVEEALDSIPTDLSIYTTTSVEDLYDVETNIDWFKNITEQDDVDAYVIDIQNAIAALQLRGTITKTVPNSNYFSATLVDDVDALITKGIISAADLSEVNDNGKNLTLIFNAFNVTSSNSGSVLADKGKINYIKDANDVIDSFIEMHIQKMIAGSAPTTVNEMPSSVTVRLTIPESMINTDEDISRTYKVFRADEDNAVALESEFNDGILSFNTNKFSVFGIGYNDLHKYNVTFKDYDGTVIDTQKVVEGTDAIAPEDPEREGYHFDGWNGDYTDISDDVEITATYEINEYTVVFKDNDGTTLETINNVEHGSSVVAPNAPLKVGLTFKGWDTSLNDITDDTIITAVYEVTKYNFTFKDYDNSVIATIKVEHGSDATIENPTREGYHFTGWDGSLTNVTSDRETKATYEINKYTVVFKDNDDTTLETINNVEHGSNVVAPNAPLKVGLTFKGWDTSLNNITSDTTITAVYEVTKYNFTFKDYDNSVITTIKVEHGSDATIEDPEREGYHFTGWDGSLTNVTSDREVKATYEINSYDIKVEATDGVTILSDVKKATYGENKEIKIEVSTNYVLDSIKVNDKVITNTTMIKLNNIKANQKVAISASLKPANYKQVDELIETIPTNLSSYTEKTVSALANVLESIDRKKTILEQKDVDKYATDLEEAISNLKLKGEIIKANRDNSFEADVASEVTSKIPLTKEEETLVANGEDIVVYLKVEDITDEIDEKDKEEIADFIEDDFEAIYLDISLIKKVGDSVATKVTDTLDYITITMNIPEKFIGKDLYVVRLHEGKVSIIKPTINDAKLTFKTNQFSTYALVYNKEKVVIPDTKVETKINTKTTRNPYTGDEIIKYIIGMMIGIFGLIMSLRSSKKYN